MRAAGFALSAAILLATPAARAKATIVVFNGDAPGQGFNDPTVAAPVGGNRGTTLGAQRLAVFQEAARIWGEVLDSAVTISIFAQFTPLPCDTSGAVLAHTAPTGWLASDPPLAGGQPTPVDGGIPNTIFPRQGTWYPVALVERFAGQKISTDVGNDLGNYDIDTGFNSALDTDPACAGLAWYYGLDDQHGEKIDLLTVALHEFGHGFGYASITDKNTGEFVQGQDGGSLPDIWAYFLYDEDSGRHWIDLDAAGRQASITGQALTWDGPAVKAAVPSTLLSAPLVRVTSAPATPSVVKDYPQLAIAQFSAQIGSSPVAGNLGVGSTRWGCTALGKLGPLDSKIAILDRGGPSPDAGCTFVEKARNAQDAGAIGLLIANNTTGLTNPGGTAPDISIPVLLVTQQDGQSLRAAVEAGTVAASIVRDPTAGFEGADPSARAYLYAPPTVAPASSVSHFDVSAFPDLLMEPFINQDLNHSLDLTVPLLRDIGWFSVDLAISANGPSTLGAGQRGTFTFTVTNPGPSPASAVTVTNALAGLTFVSNSGDCTTAFPCALGDLAPGASKTITTSLTANSTAGAATTATLTSGSDYNPTNDSATVSVNGGISTPDGGNGKSGCTAALSPPAPWLLLLALLAFARRRRPG